MNIEAKVKRMFGVIVSLIRTTLAGGKSDHGATAVEYAIMVGLIAAVVVGAVAALGIAVLGLFSHPMPF